MTRRVVLVVVAVVATIGFTALAVRGTHPDEIWSAARGSEPLWLVPSVGLLALGVWLRALRWRALFDPARRPPLWPVTAATLIGYLFSQILPLRAGEAARIVALNQRADVPLAEGAATAVIERLYDVVALLLVLFLFVPWLPDVTWLRAAAVLAVVLAAAGLTAVAALALWGDRAAHALVRPLGWLPFVPPARLEEVGRNIAHGLGGLRHPRLALTAFALTVASWLVLSFSAWLVLVSFDLGLSPAAGVLVTFATGVATVLPAGPSGIGVFEAAVVVALRVYEIDDSAALSAALVLHAANFLPLVVAGLAVLRFHVRRTLQDSRALAEN